MDKLPPSAPFKHKLIVGTLAIIVGCVAFWKAGKDFQFIKFEPHLREEVERRKRENIGMTMKSLETRTLEYTPEAKKRLQEKARALAESKDE